MTIGGLILIQCEFKRSKRLRAYFLLAQLIIHGRGQVVYLSKLAYMLLYKHTNAAHIFKTHHFLCGILPVLTPYPSQFPYSFPFENEK